MLEFIQGELLLKGINSVVVQVGGWGCRLLTSALTLEGLPPLHEEVKLFAHLHIREDELSLYGFLTAEEKEIFLTLTSVSGIGPKLALSILSKLRVPDLKRVIILGDARTLTAIPGVGKKTAERIILELKDKIGQQELSEAMLPPTASNTASVRAEVITALLALGYTLTEAERAVPFRETEQDGIKAEDLLRTALKRLAKY